MERNIPQNFRKREFLSPTSLNPRMLSNNVGKDCTGLLTDKYSSSTKSFVEVNKFKPRKMKFYFTSKETSGRKPTEVPERISRAVKAKRNGSNSEVSLTPDEEDGELHDIEIQGAAA